MIGVLMLRLIVPAVVRLAYVRPNEISIERPYIERHIQATAAAFGLNRRATEHSFMPSTQQIVETVLDASLFETIRL